MQISIWLILCMSFYSARSYRSTKHYFKVCFCYECSFRCFLENYWENTANKQIKQFVTNVTSRQSRCSTFWEQVLRLGTATQKLLLNHLPNRSLSKRFANVTQLTSKFKKTYRIWDASRILEISYSGIPYAMWFF